MWTPMDRFVPKEKMSKKAKKRLAAEKRRTWAFSPVTRKIDSKKVYSRKKISRVRYDDSGDFFVYRGRGNRAMREGLHQSAGPLSHS